MSFLSYHFYHNSRGQFRRTNSTACPVSLSLHHSDISASIHCYSGVKLHLLSVTVNTGCVGPLFLRNTVKKKLRLPVDLFPSHTRVGIISTKQREQQEKQTAADVLMNKDTEWACRTNNHKLILRSRSAVAGKRVFLLAPDNIRVMYKLSYKRNSLGLVVTSMFRGLSERLPGEPGKLTQTLREHANSTQSDHWNTNFVPLQRLYSPRQPSPGCSSSLLVPNVLLSVRSSVCPTM